MFQLHIPFHMSRSASKWSITRRRSCLRSKWPLTKWRTKWLSWTKWLSNRMLISRNFSWNSRAASASRSMQGLSRTLKPFSLTATFRSTNEIKLERWKNISGILSCRVFCLSITWLGCRSLHNRNIMFQPLVELGRCPLSYLKIFQNYCLICAIKVTILALVIHNKSVS